MQHETQQVASDQAFWLRHLHIGLVLYALGSVAVMVYLALAERPHEEVLWTAVGGALALVVVVVALPRRAIVASRHRAWFFYTWSTFSVAYLLFSSAVDGGAASPLTRLLDLPIVFAALAYPAVAVALITLVAAGGEIGLAVWFGADGGDVAIAVAVLCGVGLVATAAASHRRVQITEMAELQLRLAEQARRDGLTGCLNHRGFTDALALEVSRSRRHRRPLAIVSLDIDGFKQVNDSAGHLDGDRMLALLGSVLLAGCRQGDVAGRLGGDEFAVLLVDSDEPEAVRIADRLRRDLAERGVPVSIGVAAGVATTSEALLAEADVCLYRDKRVRRGRTTDAAPTM